jgi:uncharacterized protein YlxW (UPF0749 family)
VAHLPSKHRLSPDTPAPDSLSASLPTPRTPDRHGPGWRFAVPGVLATAGLLFATSATNARGTDLRPGRYTDLPELVSSGSARVQALRADARDLRAQVDALSEAVDNARIDRIEAAAEKLLPAVGLTTLEGPGLVVTLTDAPPDQQVPDGTDPDVLVVHQQDIQAVVNALWAGGAEAMTLQGQRIVSTTGIKCVGNTVVLHGVPYSPPYRIAALGDIADLQRGLDQSEAVATYRDYAAPPYNLGWSVQPRTSLVAPAYAGPLELSFASPAP